MATTRAMARRVRMIRAALKENVSIFGTRFARSGRTVEDWEQGRRQPDALVRQMLDRLADQIKAR